MTSRPRVVAEPGERAGRLGRGDVGRDRQLEAGDQCLDAFGFAEARERVGGGRAGGVPARVGGEGAQGVEHCALTARAGDAGGGGLHHLDAGVQRGLQALRGQRHVVGAQDVLGVDVLGIGEGHAGPRLREDEVLEGQPRRPGHE